MLQMEFVPEIIYTCLIAIVKTSILLSYNRIFGHIAWFKKAWIIIFVITVMWWISVLFSVIFQCVPVEKTWNPLMERGHCIHLIPFLWGNSVSNFIIDLVILLLPIYPVWMLQMSKTKRLLAIGSLGLGGL